MPNVFRRCVTEARSVREGAEINTRVSEWADAELSPATYGRARTRCAERGAWRQAAGAALIRLLRASASEEAASAAPRSRTRRLLADRHVPRDGA